MRSFGAWFGRLAMAGACLLAAGCGGGGDVPDPDSDSRAAVADAPSRPVDKGSAEPAAEPAPKPDAPALAVNTPAPEAEKTGPNPAVAAAPAVAPKPDEKPADADKAAPAATAPKGDASGTEELLRMAGSQSAATPDAGGSPAPGSAPAAAAAPGGGAPAPGGAVAPGTPPGGNDRRRAAGRGGEPGPAAAGAAGAAGEPGPGGSAMAGGPGAPPAAGGPGGTNPGGAPGEPGSSGFGAMAGSGPGGGDSVSQGTAAFNRPWTAVQAFLAALKAKDKDRLSQTVARRAPTEAAEKHRKIFSAIVEGSISDDELDEMSKALDGFQVVSQLEARSTGRIGILVSKMAGRDRLQRTIITRKEKEGWKVLDVENMIDFKPAPIMPRRRR